MQPNNYLNPKGIIGGSSGDFNYLATTNCVEPEITSALSLNVQPGQAISYIISARNSILSLGASSLPSFLSFDGVSVVSGTAPSILGEYEFNIIATNACGQDFRTVTITVDVNCSITLGTAYSYTLTPIAANVSNGGFDPNVGFQLYLNTNPLPLTSNVGPGTNYPFGFSQETLNEIFSKITNWSGSIDIGFSGNNGAAFAFSESDNPTQQYAQVTACPPAGFSLSQVNLSISLFNQGTYPWAYSYNNLIYPYISLHLRISGVLVLVSSLLNLDIIGPCMKLWHGGNFVCQQANPMANSVPMFFDENNEYDADTFQCDSNRASQIQTGGATLSFS